LQTNQIRQLGLAFCCTVADFLDLGANIFLSAIKYKFIITVQKKYKFIRTSKFIRDSTKTIQPNLYM
jgi:hypothetical protein